MLSTLKQIARFYSGWRLPLIAISAVLLFVGLFFDSWWSALAGAASLGPLLMLYALTGRRVGMLTESLDHTNVRIDETHTRIEPIETRLGHAESRDRTFENQIGSLSKRFGRLEGGTTKAPASPEVTTGEIMSLYRLALDVEAADDDPLVTVVVPCFNESRFIGDAIKSLKAQTFQNFVAIVVDDASTDDSVSVALAEIGADDRFHVVRHGVNSGLSAGRNTGLRLATTPYVCFLDADDFFYVDNLEERVRTLVGLHDSVETVGVFSGVEHVSEHITFEQAGSSSPAKLRSHAIDHLKADGSCPFNCHAPMLRTEVLQRFGGFDESMKHGAEDWECWQRILRHGYVFQGIPLTLAVYRQKMGSMVRAMPGQHLGEAKRLLGLVHEPIDPERIVSDTPYVFDQPIGHYRHEMQMTDRALQFMGMAYLTENEEQMGAALEQVDPALWPIAERNLSVSSLLDQGIRRAFTLDAKGFAHLGGKVKPIRDALLKRLAEHSESAPPQVLPTSEMAEVDVAFLPANAAQAKRMSDVASQLPADCRSIMVEVNILSGASGVAQALDLSWTGERASLNEWTLGGNTPRGIVAAWPYGPTISDALEAARAGGATTLELRGENSTIDRLEESGSIECESVAESADDIVASLPARDAAHASQPMRRHSDVALAALALTEEYPRLPADISDVASFHNKHVGEKCVIIGNGPSLNDLELGRLRDQYTIGVNGIFYAEAIDYPLSYYVVEDTSVMNENLEAIKAYGAGHKFFPTIYRDLYGKVDVAEGSETGVTFFTMNRGFYAAESPNFCVPRFSTDASQRLYCGQSVTIINLQLAYYMGFSEVYLIGMDFSYTIPDSAEVKGDLITSTEDDPNHFHKDYFGKGKTWKDPKLERVLNNYHLAKVMFEADGRKIYNATAGGKLELFERRDFHEVFSAEPTTVRT